jgi:hypothetical protein
MRKRIVRILGSFSLVIVAVASLQGSSSTTPGLCQRYAQRAVQQYQLMANRPKCNIRTDGRWHANYKAHYDWCLSAQRAWTITEENARDTHLYKCGAQVRFD